MNKGFSFLELMVVSLILSVVLGAIFAVAYQAQMSFESEKQFTETTQNARIAMDQIVRYIRQAGNDPTKACIDENHPAVSITNDHQIELNSDITGSIDGRTGDPDGRLTSPFEVITISYTGSAGRLFIDVNDGSGPMVMADNLSSFSFQFFDKDGASTTDSTSVAMVRVNMTANTERPDRRTGLVNTISFHSDVFVRSMSFDLFEPAPSS